MAFRSYPAPFRRSARTALGVPLLLVLGVAACADGGNGTDDTAATVGVGDSTAPSSSGSTTAPGTTSAATQAPPGGSSTGAPPTSGPSGSAAPPTSASSPSATTADPEGMAGAGNTSSPDDGTVDTGAPTDDDSPSGDDPSTDDPDETADDPGTENTGGAGGTSSTGDDTSEGGAATGGNGGAGGSDGAPSGECTRELLDGLIDDYFAALAGGDPSSLPLAATVKFTENAEETEIGTTDFWMNAGDVKHSQRALDTTACAAAVQAVVPEGTTDLPIGLRIKVEASELTEIETIVVRQGDYTASYAVDNNPGRIIEIAAEIGWHDEVPEGDRAAREELSAWIDKYFRAFPGGVCDVTSSCVRLENGGGPNFSCGDGAMCNQGAPGDGGTMIPRLIIVDEVRGIAAGLTIFDYFNADGHLDMHMMKMSGGQVHAVHALLRDTEGESGWD